MSGRISGISIACGRSATWAALPWIVAGALAIFAWHCLRSRASAASRIAEENARPGDASWVLTNPADHEIEGFASATSINRGESLRLYVNTVDPSFTLRIYRMGWYGGAGARRVLGDIVLPGTQQPMPAPDQHTGFVECNWQVSYRLSTSSTDSQEWLSGVYLVRLTGTRSGKQSYIIFVIREDDRASDVLFQSSVTTYQAYNNWGGQSTYPSNSTNERWARKVSFNRPYAMSQHPQGGSGVGAGECLTAMSIHPTVAVSTAGWEDNMVRWLERQGYDVIYSTNIDTHANGTFWRRHKAWLSVGHDEYWSRDMRTHVEAARDHGVGLGFFSANTCYWQIRLEPSPITGEPNRTMVTFKEMALSEDPLALDTDPANDHLVTTQWREAPVAIPEHRLLGVMYETVPIDGDIVIIPPAHPLFTGVRLPPDHRLPGLLGYEIDRTFPDGPANLSILTHSPYPKAGPSLFGEMTLYEAPSGAYVFAAGTIQWSWGLDDYNSPQLLTNRANEVAARITRNILSLLTRGAATPCPSPISYGPEPTPG